MLSTILIAAGLKAQNTPVVKKETMPQGIKTINSSGIVADTAKLTNQKNKITTRFDKLTNSTIKNTDRPDKQTPVFKGGQTLPDTVSKAIKITNSAQQLKNTQIEKSKPFKY